MSDVALTPAQQRYHDALADVLATAQQLQDTGQEARLSGLLVGVDLCIAAAFLWSTTDADCDRATASIRQAIAQATREGD